MDIWNNLNSALERLTFGHKKQLAFLEDFSSLIEDGMPVRQAILTIKKTSSRNNQLVANSILQAIAQGQPLTLGMEDWFYQTVIEIIRAGEEGGSLLKSLKTAISLLRQQTSTLSKVISATTYPCVVIIMGCAVAVFLKHSILTNFANIKPVELWPQNGQILYYTATVIEDFWWFILLLVAALALTIHHMFKELTGPTRIVIDKLPLFSIYRKIMAARFMETLGILVSNGLTFREALNIIRHHSNHYLRWHVHNMQAKLSSGYDNLADILDTKLISQREIVRLSIISRGTHFEPALTRLGDNAALQNVKMITLTGKVTGAILLCLGALWTIFMIFAVYGVGTVIAA